MTSDNGKDQAPQEEAVLLELSTVAPPRQHIVIDGDRYALVNRSSLGFVQMNRFTRLQRQLYTSEDLDPEDQTDEQVAATSRAMDEIIQIALPDCPRRTLALLPDIDKLRLVRVFTKAVYAPLQEIEVEVEALDRETAASKTSTGAKSSRGLSGSTGSRRASSSSKRRIRSSKP